MGLSIALLRHDRYDKGAVLERIKETKSAPELLKPLAAFVEERFRFSRYEPESHFIVDDLRKAIELLKGAGGKKELARLGKLPEIGDWAKALLE